MAERRFTRQQLYDLVWSEPMVRLAKRHGISDRGLAKACARAGIPVPERGYWAKREAGYKVKQVPLPAAADGTPDTIIIDPPGPKRPVPPPPPLPPAVQAKIDEEKKPENQVAVAKTLANAHRIVAGWIEDDRRKREIHRHDRWYLDSSKPLDRDPLARRRLLILSAVFKALEVRGYRLLVERHFGDEVHIELKAERLVIEVRERVRQIRRVLTEKEHREKGYLSTGQKWTQERQATGELVLGIRERETRRYSGEWRDSSERPLEEQLNDVLGGIAAEFERIRAYREQQEIARQRQWEEDRKRHAREMERKREVIRFRRLIACVENRKAAADIRSLVDVVRGGYGSDSVPVEHIDQWSRWALACADRIDPLKSSEMFDMSVDDSEVWLLKE